MFGDSVTIGQAVIVCVFSLAVVFLVLLALSYMIDLTARILAHFSRSSGAAAPAPAVTPEAGSADAVLVAAAIAAYLGSSPDRFVVRSIRRVSGEQSLWSQAGRTSFMQ